MKSIVKSTLLLLSGLVMFFAVSCDAPSDTGDGKISIICTAFAQYDWAKAIVGDKAENFDIVLLADNGVDMHSYQPTAQDIINLSQSELVISVGGASEKWIQDALENSADKNVSHIKLLEVLGDKALLLDSTHVCDVTHEHEEHNDSEYDEHVWLSLNNAMIFCNAIADSIASLDEQNAAYYSENAKKYVEKLTELDKRVRDGVRDSEHNILLFADRFPFRYFVNDYELEYYAAFDGCTSDSRASFETIFTLSKKVDEIALDSVLTVDGSDGSIAEAVVSNTIEKNQNILTLESMQSVKNDDISGGISYLSVMENNIEIILTALN